MVSNIYGTITAKEFAATNTEILWETAQYGDVTNSQFTTYAQPGSRGGKYGSLKAMQFMITHILPIIQSQRYTPRCFMYLI